MQPQQTNPPTSPQANLPSRFSSLDHKDILLRTIKTAAATFVATLLATNQPLDKQAIIAAIAAAGTAVLNYVLQLAGA